MHAHTPDPDTPPDATATGTVDRQAFAILAREHHRNLLVYGRALTRDESTAADLVQEAFVTAWQNLARFDVTRNFGAWMRGIVRNKWREHLRQRQHEVDVDDQTLELWEQRFSSWDEGRQQGRGELFEQLDDCLSRLPDAMREAVTAFYYRHQPGGALAAALGIDATTLRKRLQRSREALRECLDHKFQLHA
ncbi:MAG TPA: RNA polymerase sigma factor [Luteolibacter sp.]|nr:RNA polymerase sigma factor [Luteolibacter sp.]